MTVGHEASVHAVLEGSPQAFRWWGGVTIFCLSLALLPHKPSRPETQ